jgi:TM2 domain-containing membrane protein YozV
MSDNGAGPDLAVYESGRKSMAVAYVLWLFLGWFGAHRFYARAGRTGWWMLGLQVAGWTLGLFGWQSVEPVDTNVFTIGYQTAQDFQVVGSFDNGPLGLIGSILRRIGWVWWLVDVFLVPGMVRRWNMRLASALGVQR